MKKLLCLITFLVLSCGGAFAQAINPQWFVTDRQGQASNFESQCDKPANVSVGVSGLTMTAKQETVQCGNATTAPSTYNYTGTMLVASSNSFTYGIIDFQATMLAAGTGLSDLLWLQGINSLAQLKLNAGSSPRLGYSNWPAPYSDEIDVDEYTVGVGAGNVHQGIHSSTHNDQCTPAVNAAVSHHYEFDWSAGSGVWYVDGVQTCSIVQAYFPSTPMFLILNLSVGGLGGGTITASFPQSLTFQWVRVCPTAVGQGNCTQGNASIFDDEFNGTGPLSNVYVAQNFQGNATGLDCADAFGLLNYLQGSWLQDAGNFSNGQIGPGTTVHLCGNWTTTPVISGSGTSGSPITVAYEPTAYGPCPNTAGQTNIVFTGTVCPQAAGPGASVIQGTQKIDGTINFR